MFLKELHLNESTNCVGGRSLLRLHLDYASDFIRRYGSRGFFGFMFFSIYSHDTNSRLGWVDRDLDSFLSGFRDTRADENTLLVVFSDHGPRFSSERKTTKGLLKERNPFLAIYSPLSKHRTQLEANSKRLVTSLDLSHSLLDLIYHLKRKKRFPINF